MPSYPWILKESHNSLSSGLIRPATAEFRRSSWASRDSVSRRRWDLEFRIRDVFSEFKLSMERHRSPYSLNNYHMARRN